MPPVLPYEPPDQSPQQLESARDDRMFLLATLVLGALISACVAAFGWVVLWRGAASMDMSSFWSSAMVTGVMVLPGLVQATVKLVSGGPDARLATWVLLVNLAPIAMHGVIIIVRG